MPRSSILKRLLLLIIMAIMMAPFAAEAVPAGFVNEIVVTGLNIPTQMSIAPDGRIFVIEKLGLVRVVLPGASTPLATPLLDLTSNIYVEHEAGLLGMMLAPDFATSGIFYVYYTSATPQVTRLSRFRASGNETLPGSEQIIWQDMVTAANAHHGGATFFGNDGKIYILSGDQLQPADSQNLASKHGKVLRINPDGTIPADNPFFDGAGPNQDEIWAYGVRNPFRGSVDPDTGRIFVGDVGGNDQATAVEEVHIIRRGANYGWPTCESSCAPNISAPLYSYPHNGVRASVIGGFVYRGMQFPPEYRGRYFFADYARHWIKNLSVTATDTLSQLFNFEPVDGANGGPYGEMVDLKPALDGSLYYLDIGGGLPNNGTIHRIRYIAGNQPPSVSASASPVSGLPPLTVQFSGAGTTDPEGDPLTYSWNVGEGPILNGSSVSHNYATEGVYTARLTVSDGTSSVTSAPISISVGQPPTVNITSPAFGAFFRAGDVIGFSGTAVDRNGAALPASAYQWTVNFRHDEHFHPVMSLDGATSGQFTIATTGHGYEGNTSYEITLTAKDTVGLTSAKTVSVFPQKVNLAFQTSPAGLQLRVDGIHRTALFVIDTLVNFHHSVEAFSQSAGGQQYAFSSWSDGAPALRTIIVPAANSNYSASFNPVAGTVPLLNLPLDEGSGTIANDISGNGNNGSLENNPSRVAGRVGPGAISFDGIDDHLEVSGTATLNASLTGFTATAWVYRTVNQANWASVLSRQKGTGTGEHFYLGFRNGAYRFFASTSGGTSSSTSGATGALNQWVHLAGSYDGANVRFYVNGALQFTTPLVGTVPAETNPIIIGGNINTAGAPPTELFRGTIDDVRFYRQALTPAEIGALAQGTLPPDTTAPIISAISSVSTTNGATINWMTNEASDTQVQYGTTTSYGSSTTLKPALVTGHSDSITGLLANTLYHYRVLSKDAAGNSAVSADQVFTTQPASTLPSLLKLGFDEASGTTAADASGNNNPASLMNGPLHVTGRVGSGAIGLDGVNDYGQVNGSASLNPARSAITVAGWVYRTTSQAGWAAAISRQLGATTGEHFLMGFKDNRYRFFVTTSAGTSSTTLGNAAPLNMWVHVAGTYDGANVRFYVNGALQFTTALTGSIGPDTTPIIIGGNVNGTAAAPNELFRGRVDDIRIYPQALSVAQIQQMMNGTLP